MIKNYLLTTVRELQRDYLYSLINIIGLSVSLGCFILLALYLEAELGYDRHFEDHENIYRIVQEQNRSSSGESIFWAQTSPQIPPILKQLYPEVRDYTRFRPASNSGALILRNKDTSLYWENVFLAVSTFYQSLCC